MARIVFDVTTTAVEAALWVRVRGQPPQILEMDEFGRAEAQLPEGRHDLFWSVGGPPGALFALTARQAGVTVLEAAGAIPPRTLDASGAERFSIKGREALRELKAGAGGEVIAFHPARAPVTATPAATALEPRRSFAAAE